MKFGYRFFGNSIANFLSKPYFDFLKDKVSHDFLGREIYDLGCGDGFATTRIKELFKAKTIVGYEINDDLIKRARKRGIEVKKMDLGEDFPTGEMVTVWGVLHHLGNKDVFLNKVTRYFQYAVFCEPVKNLWSFLDGGEPLPEEEWKNLFRRHLTNCQFLRFKDSLFIFWRGHQPKIY